MSDVDPTLAAITDTYTDWLATHGADSSRSVGWHDPLMQALRFDVLALVMEGTEPVTVADFGCGTGALFDRLAARAEPPPLGGYTGYDLVPAMVEAARERHSDPRARFEVGSAVAEDHDYVFASGAFTVRPGIDDDTWEAHLHEVISRPVGSRAPRDRVQRHDPHAQAGRAARLHRQPQGLGGLVLAEPPRGARRAAHGAAAGRLRRARQTRAARRVTWLETASETFVARYDERDTDDAERVLAQLEYARERLQRKLDVQLGDLAVVLHPTSAQLDAAQPWLPLQRARTAPAARRYVVGTVTEEEIHVLAPRVLAQRASNVEGSLELLMLAPSALLAKRMLAVRKRPWRRQDAPWRLEGAAQFFSGQIKHIRPAVVLRIHERPAPSFPPGRRDALLLGGTVFDLLHREEGDDACLELARAPDPQKALERAFHGRPFRQTEQAWRSHLNRLARPG